MTQVIALAKLLGYLIQRRRSQMGGSRYPSLTSSSTSCLGLGSSWVSRSTFCFITNIEFWSSTTLFSSSGLQAWTELCCSRSWLMETCIFSMRRFVSSAFMLVSSGFFPSSSSLARMATGGSVGGAMARDRVWNRVRCG